MIYFIQDSATTHVKIGVTSDPWRRRDMLQTGAPGELTVIALEDGGREREAELHAMFAAARMRGEWFAFSEQLQRHVASLGAPVRPAVYSRSRGFWGGMTAAEVARAAGVTKGTLSCIQNGKRRPSPELAVRLQKVSGVSAVKLVFGDLLDELEVA